MSIKKGSTVIAGAPLPTIWGGISGDILDQEDLQQALAGKLSSADAALTGSPTAPTPAAGLSNDQIATTKFVSDALENIEALPSQTGQNGKFLKTNGEEASWEKVDALPSQTGQNGKFLKTNGYTSYWDQASPTITYWVDD